MSEDVVLDANVLHPIVLCDLLLRLALEGLYRPLWSGEILEETKRTILRRRPDLDRRALAARIAAMRHAFPEALVRATKRVSRSAPIWARTPTSSPRRCTPAPA